MNEKRVLFDEVLEALKDQRVIIESYEDKYYLDVFPRDTPVTLVYM